MTFTVTSVVGVSLLQQFIATDLFTAHLEENAGKCSAVKEHHPEALWWNISRHRA